jgi:undecaprenyl-diphosphatase
MTRQSDKTRDSIRRVLEDHLAEVVSSDVATRIVQQARAASNGASEAAQARTASRAPGSGVARIESAARGQSSRGRLAAILVEIATQGMASTGEAHAIAEAAYDVLGSGTHRIPLATGLGRTLLREAAIRGVGPAVKLEARAFLAVSTLPHPAWLHAACEVIGALATGGCIWMVGVLGTYLLRTEGSERAVKVVLPTVAVVALISERPAKVFFAPRRPFGHLLHMMLLGQKPRGRSFPSGHAATSFAGAWVLGSVWPRRRPVFLGLATLVSLSRVYLGAHDPGEILAGTVLGVGLAELLRRLFDKLLAQVDLPKPPRTWNPSRQATR